MATIKTTMGQSQTDTMTQKAITDAVIERTVGNWEEVASGNVTTSKNLVAKNGAFAYSSSALNLIKSIAVNKGDIIRVVVVNGDYTSGSTFDMISFSEAIPVQNGSGNPVTNGTETPLYQTDAKACDEVVVAPGDGYIHVYFKDRTSGTRGVTFHTPVSLVNLLNAESQARAGAISSIEDRLTAAEAAVENVASGEEMKEMKNANIAEWEEISFNNNGNLIVNGNAFATASTRNVYYFQAQKGSFYKFVVANANSTATKTIGLAIQEPADGVAIDKKITERTGASFTETAYAESNAYMFIAIRRDANFSIKIYKGITAAESITNRKYIGCLPQFLTNSEKEIARGNIGALSSDLILENTVGWEEMSRSTDAETISSGEAYGRNTTLALIEETFVTTDARDVFYIMAEENTAYKFEAVNTYTGATKTLGMVDEVPANGVSISERLQTTTDVNFTMTAVAGKRGYIFIAIRRNANFAIRIYKGVSIGKTIRENNYVTTTQQTLTANQQRTARENIGAAAEGGNSIRILFIGNSLTQDCIAYLPALLDEVAPNINYQFYDWFVGGYRLDEHYAKFTNNQTAGNFSISHRNGAWTHLKDGNAVTINQVLQNYEFDVLVLQDFFNGSAAATDETSFQNIIDYIRENYTKPFKVVTLLPPPKRSEAAGGTINNSIYTKTMNVNKLVLQKTEAMSVIDVCDAIAEATKTALNELGDDGRLSPDGTHSQDGLPCLMQSYVLAMWIFSELGLPYGIVGSKLRITAQLSDSLNIPGPHPGTGLIEGTEEQHAIAQLCAIKADKLGRKFEMEAISEM